MNKCGSCLVALDYGTLGSSEFVQGLLSEVDEHEKETLRLSSKIKGLSSLARDQLRKVRESRD